MVVHQAPMAISVSRGVLAGVAGTVVMTVFQKLVEMPLTRRDDSYAPAEFAGRVLPVQPRSDRARTRLNYMTHFALGAMWGSAYGVAGHFGLRGRRALATVFATVYSGDVVLNTALGLYKPWEWSHVDWAIDVVDKLVQAGATGVAFDHVLKPGAR